jgi:hypothetical protein
MPRVKLANGALRDQIRQDIFDTIIQEEGAVVSGVNEFFTSVQGKPAHLTNLRQNQMLENQVSYLVQGLGFNAVVRDAANVNILPLIMDHSAFKLVIGEKIYWEGPLRYIAGNIEQEGAFLAQLGSYDNAKYALKGQDSIAIPPLQSFKCRWEVLGLSAADADKTKPVAGTKVHYVARLLGLLRRPVQ